ncbi:hypothetical protein NEOKW01_1673 [Nematocida sp. AWRm80]|nr:hypothetical protein NEOKW01_1673 [Nematocida sp. AWRm80]
MDQWRVYFNSQIAYPGVITDSILLYGTTPLVVDSNDLKDYVHTQTEEEIPRPPIYIGDTKYFFVRDITTGEDIYLLSIYQKVKASPTEPTIILFVLKIDSFTWVGCFNNEQIPSVMTHLESVATRLYNDYLQTNEE